VLEHRHRSPGQRLPSPVAPLLRPRFDVATHPQQTTAGAHVDRRCGKVGVTASDGVHRLGVRKAEQLEHMNERHGDDAVDWLARHEVWAAQRVDPTTLRR
jgi:hypothetical protein